MNETVFWILCAIGIIIFLQLWGIPAWRIVLLPIQPILWTLDIIQWAKKTKHNWGKTKREIEIEEAFDKLLEEKFWHEFACNPKCVKHLALTGEFIRPSSATITRDDVHRIMTKSEIAELAKKAGTMISNLIKEDNNV